MTPRRDTTIALDFDCTFTSDIEFWRLFVRLCAKRGHKVVLVTARFDTIENRVLVADVLGRATFELLSGAVFTGRQPKRPVAEEQGFRIDIWIDDLPEFVGDASLELLETIKSQQSIFETLPVVSMGAVDPNAVWEPNCEQ
jgi:hypothetical protein